MNKILIPLLIIITLSIIILIVLYFRNNNDNNTSQNLPQIEYSIKENQPNCQEVFQKHLNLLNKKK